MRIVFFAARPNFDIIAALEEAEKLQNKDYQRELSEIIFESLKEYFINIGKLKKEEISLILSD